MTMFLRRDFFRNSLGLMAGAGLATVNKPAAAVATTTEPSWLVEYREALSASKSLGLLGTPRSGWSLKNGFHPFTPERICIARTVPSRRSLRSLKDKVCAFLKEDEDQLQIDEESMNRLLWTTYSLAARYGVKRYLTEWAKCVCWHHSLSREYWSGGIEVLRHFQRNRYICEETQAQPVSTFNAQADWWLFLFPADSSASIRQDKQIHAVLAPVHSGFEPGRFTWKLGFFAERIADEAVQLSSDGEDVWRQLAQRTEHEVALFLNECVHRHLQRNPEELFAL